MAEPHTHCDNDPIECNVEATQGQLAELQRRVSYWQAKADEYWELAMADSSRAHQAKLVAADPCPFVDGYGSGCELIRGHLGNHRFASDELLRLRKSEQNHFRLLQAINEACSYEATLNYTVAKIRGLIDRSDVGLTA